MTEQKLLELIQEMVTSNCGCMNTQPPPMVVVGDPGPTAAAEIEPEPNEGYMVMQNLQKIHEYSGKLVAMLDESMDLPEWTEDKLATCADRMSSVYHYLEYKMGKGPV